MSARFTNLSGVYAHDFAAPLAAKGRLPPHRDNTLGLDDERDQYTEGSDPFAARELIVHENQLAISINLSFNLDHI